MNNPLNAFVDVSESVATLDPVDTSLELIWASLAVSKGVSEASPVDVLCVEVILEGVLVTDDIPWAVESALSSVDVESELNNWVTDGV